jgi:hypothetical protein
MKTVTQQEMTLLNQIKNFIENEFSSSNYMWMYLSYMSGDMKINRGLMSSLMQKGIIAFNSFEDENDAIEVNQKYWVEENFIANFINISVK